MRCIRPAGQSMIETVILLVAAVATLVAMFGMVRSGVMGSMKSGADGIGQGLRYRGWR